jgi:hypothetical protein
VGSPRPQLAQDIHGDPARGAAVAVYRWARMPSLRDLRHRAEGRQAAGQPNVILTTGCDSSGSDRSERERVGPEAGANRPASTAAWSRTLMILALQNPPKPLLRSVGPTQSIQRTTLDSVSSTPGSAIRSMTASMAAMSSPSTIAMTSGVPSSASARTTPGSPRISRTTRFGPGFPCRRTRMPRPSPSRRQRTCLGEGPGTPWTSRQAADESGSKVGSEYRDAGSLACSSWKETPWNTKPTPDFRKLSAPARRAVARAGYGASSNQTALRRQTPCDCTVWADPRSRRCEGAHSTEMVVPRLNPTSTPDEIAPFWSDFARRDELPGVISSRM